MIDQETIQVILGIKEEVHVKPKEMADKMNITFFPYDKDSVSREVISFKNKLENTFKDLNVNIVPYDKSLVKIPLYKVFRAVFKMMVSNMVYIIRFVFKLPQKNHYFDIKAIQYLFKRTKIKKGISVIVLGEQDDNNLPMQYIYNFKDNSIITIIDFPKNISEESSFHDHFDTALSLFTHNMTNIIIGVDDKKWLLYNFNASHPIFLIEKDFKENILHALVPKIVAPIRPYKLSEFKISKGRFNPFDDKHKNQTNDLISGASIFSKTSLYPSGKKIDDLPFRNEFYKWIGKLHLDNRNGMSYGFLATQLPGDISDLMDERFFFSNYFKGRLVDDFEKPYYKIDDNIFIRINLNNQNFWLKVPDVWVISQKSGSDKTNVNPNKDLIKIGLVNGQMILEAGTNSVIDNDYKPSFDTQVILAHCVGNAIIASISNYLGLNTDFLNRYKNRGISISHWHGYIHPDHVQKGWYVHGVSNPHVACSSPQSAIYALDGKLKSFMESLNNNEDYKGDIHIEPHHGTNICYTSVTELANYLVNNPNASVLGNSYYYLYNK